MIEEIYDVIVLGGGAGGVAAAIRASQLGGTVAIIESNELGGQCMNRGCIPFGQMMVASNILRSLSLGKELGLNVKGVTKDYPTLTKRQNELIEFMRMGVRTTLKKNGIAIIEGSGKITGAGTVEVEGNKISYKNIILATGAQWQKPTFPGSELDEVVTTEYLLTAGKLPQKALLSGQSPWLAEIAQFLKRFDSKVILATPDKSIFSAESKAISSRLTKAFKEEGIELKTEAEIRGVTKKKDGLHVELISKGSKETAVVDNIITLERAAALKRLGLGSIGLDENRDHLTVNDKMETGIKGVYAIGDLTGPPSHHYSHRASEMGIAAAENAMGGDSAINPKTTTRVLFTHPQLASVGLTPREAKAEGYEVITGAAPLSMNPFGMIISENEGLVEVVAEKSYGEVLGVHIIGSAAAEMIGQAVVAIQMEATIEALAKVSFPHPTLSESLAEAARDALGRPIYLP